jgi:transcriptional regulator with XRE-family HTH domain
MRSKVFQRILDNTPEDIDLFVDWYADLVVRIHQLLKEKNLSQKELAEKMGKQPSEISKWLSGAHNFTLRSLAKLSAELGEPLLEVPKRKSQANFIRGYSRSVHTFVIHKRIDPSKTAKTVRWQKANELTPMSNVG